MMDNKRSIVVDSFYEINSLLAGMMARNSKLTPEEKTANRKANELRIEKECRKYQVIKNVCPSCEGKLIRGQKDKRNDYKRLWTCRACGDKYTNEGDLYA